MRVTLVGSDCEENLGIGMIGAALLRAGHRVEVVSYTDVAEVDAVVERVLRQRPKLIGLGIQFQHRSYDFLLLARKLRQAGFTRHLTCGGHYPSMAWAEVLANEPDVDSVVLHEGERTVVELCQALQRGESLAGVAGLALRDAAGNPVRTAPRCLSGELDELPFAYRYRAPTRHLGIPFRPLWGSRGCWGSCAFCAITTGYREAHAHGGGRKLRLRSPANIAAEMAMLWHAEGGPCLFCFHDDTLLLPRPADSLERLRDMRRALDELGVGPVGLIGKCRPDCVTPELAREMRKLGVFRMFVGVENGSQRGLDHLNRRTTIEDIEQALGSFEAAGIFVCYNLLLFEPDGVLEDVRENIAFIRRHPAVPVNFCRAEPYHGTPLYRRVRERGTLLGCYLGWDYRIQDDRTELAFRMAAAAFRERNYDAEGVANRTMGLGYTAQLLRCFFDVTSVRGRRLLERAEKLIRDVSLDTADLLEQVVDFAARADLRDHDRITRETALLGLRVAAYGRLWHGALDDLMRDIDDFAAGQPRRAERATVPDKARALLEQLAMAGCLAASLQACGGETDGQTDGGTAGDKGSGGYQVVDPVPMDSGLGGRAAGGGPTGGYQGDGGVTVGGYANVGGRATGGIHYDGVGGALGVGGRNTGGYVVDPLVGSGGRATGGINSDGGSPPFIGGRPGTGGQGYGGFSDPVGGALGVGGRNTGGIFADPLPVTGGRSTGGYTVVDCAPVAAGTATPSERPPVVDPAPPDRASPRRELVEQWRDTAPRHVTRSRDLPLFDPPVVRLESRVEGDSVEVTVQSDEPNLSVRWQCEGSVSGEGRKVSWQPTSSDDALCVAVRGPGGVAVASLRARDLPDR